MIQTISVQFTRQCEIELKLFQSYYLYTEIDRFTHYYAFSSNFDC